ncbi:MAG: hypothetical protein OK452_10265 [Thaumarchaeota archaeon]|nr:hypothetical protein [Nitrososphaerota archaeon]
MKGYESVKRAILATEDPTERKIRFMALLTSSLPKGKMKPVLAGGSAIEVYLDGTLRTGDMDVVYNVKALEEVLKAWGFALGGGLRAWANEELGLAVDLVGEDFNGSYERVTTITTDFGPATIIGIEDLIVKRLSSAKFWKAPTDIEQAYLLAKAHDDRIDWPYVEEEARKADITDYLAKLKTMLKKGTGRKR